MSAGSLRELGPGNGARRACSFRRNCTLADENRARDTGYLCRYCTARICDRLCRSPWARNRGNFCCSVGLAGNRYTSISREKRWCPDSAVGGRAGCAVQPTSCHLPVRKVPVWSTFGCPLRLWAAPTRIPEAVTREEEAGEGGTPPWWPDMYGLPGYRSDLLPGLAPGGTFAIDLNVCDDFSCGCVREKTCRSGGSWSYVIVTLCERHRHQVGRVHGSNSRSR